MATRRKGTLPGDIYVDGELTAQSMDYPTGSIRAVHIDPMTQLSSVLIEQQYVRDVRQFGAVVNRTEPIHVAIAAGEVLSIDAGMIVPPTLTATVTIDLLKNGVTILSSTLVINNGLVARDTATTGITGGSEDYVAGDWFDVQTTIATPTGVIGSGLFIRVVFREKTM